MSVVTFDAGSSRLQEPCTEIRVNRSVALRYYPNDGTLALADGTMARQLREYFSSDDGEPYDVNVPGHVIGLPGALRFVGVRDIVPL